MMRIDKYLSDCGQGTRKEIKALIKNRKVCIDGKIVTDASEKVNCDSVITLDGIPIIYRKYVYIMMNKPQDYISATEDKNYPVVTDLLAPEYAHFSPSPVGRLDIDTEGLLLLTNDGKLNHELTAPKKNIYKTYFAILDKEADADDIQAFADGMEFKDFTAKSAVLQITENKKEVYISISEGKFHQVKRMCERVGKKVLYLKRISIGDLKLDENLKTGEYRELSEHELNILKNQSQK